LIIYWISALPAPSFLNLRVILEEIKKKIDFEKSEYKVISSKLKENNRLFDAIPAIRPCLGKILEPKGSV
jgi:hypothetical protein